MEYRIEDQLMQFINPILDSACEEAQIHRLERVLKTTFPTDYRQFLRQWNGLDFNRVGYVLLVRVPRENAVVPFDQIYGISHGDEDDILARQSEYAFDGRVPTDYFAIGGLNGPVRIAMSKIDGTIYGWDPVLPGEPDGENIRETSFLTKIARSFRDFWESVEMQPV